MCSPGEGFGSLSQGAGRRTEGVGKGKSFGERCALRRPTFCVSTESGERTIFSIKKRTALRNSLQWGLEQVLGGEDTFYLWREKAGMRVWRMGDRVRGLRYEER